MRQALPRNTILVGDAVEQLKALPSSSVDTVITSPPYWALRNYQVDGQLGLEPSVHGWVEHLSSVMAEIARVLKPTGSVWLNLGDTYSRQDAHGAPAKSLVLAPERLLLALSADGWIVRNKVVWAKPNPMPVSTRDRLACTWEPIYLLVRSRSYYFDLDAIRVPHRTTGRRQSTSTGGRRPPGWAGPLAGRQDGLHRLKAAGLPGHPLGKNPGDVWTIPTSTFRGGHFATYPPALVERPLRATCPERTCSRCGEPWVRPPVERALGHLAVLGTLLPGCNCQAPHRPGVVLDPFIGSGTTAVVAESLGRDWLGIELNPDFAAIAEERLAKARGDERAAA